MDHSPKRHRQFRGPHREHRWKVVPLPRRPRWRASWRELRVVVLAGALIGLVASGVWSGADRAGAGTGAVAGERARFGSCHSGGGTNCVVDGDTFWMHGEKIRIANIDAPETHPPRCAEEKRLGEAATARLRALLNAGPVTLAIEGRDTDRYGRKLRVVMRDGESLGDMLVAEGLARPWGGRRTPWC